MDDPREAQRLINKVDAKEWCAKYIASQLTQGGSFLDVGCGPGHILAEVYREHPSTFLYGVDISEERLGLASRALPAGAATKFYKADIESLPLPDNLVNCVFSRFLLEYVREKQQAVDELARVTSPGGTVILQDLDSQFLSYYPNEAEVDAEIIGLLRSLEVTGFDPNVGRKLFTFAKRAGLQNIRVQVEPYHLYQGPPNESHMRAWRLKFDIATKALAQGSGRSEAAIRQLTDRYLALLQRPDNFFYSILVTVICTKE
jgi:ubiquinone/menaquinone biosynthesis C-methylase UbiE